MSSKESILKLLLDQKGKFISGEEVSEKVKISRTAVWKHIVKLKEEGYPIRAVSGKGYQLSDDECVYSQSAIASRLNTKLLGKNLIFLHKSDSTNNVLKRLSADNAPEGTVVIAENQTAGRGRRGRNWISKEDSGITLSVLLKPELEPGAVQAITLAASSAVCHAIEPFICVKPGIKWPNDILLNHKKVCGILTEMTAEPDKIHSIILGIGVNVNHTVEDFDESLRDSATSLRMHAEGKISRSLLVVRILEELEKVYLNYIQKKSTEGFLNIWRSFSVTIGYDIIIYQNKKIWEAKALDVLKDGSLLVETPDGGRRTITSGEITIRRAGMGE